MKIDLGQRAPRLRVDGGAAASNFLMQFQADIIGLAIEHPSVTEMTARGAAYLAGLGVVFWASQEEVANVVVFFVSDLSSYVNGETIMITGGRMS